MKTWFRKWTALCGFLLLCVLTVVSAYLGITIGAARLSPAWAFNVGADVVSIMVCMLLFYGCFSEKQNEDESIRLFMPLLLSDAVILFLDILTWLAEGVAGLRTLYVIVYTLYLCCVVLLSYQYWRYVREYLALDSKLMRRCNLAMRVLLAPALLVSLANLFVPLCFYIDEQGVFYYEDGYWLSYAYYVIMAVCLTLCLLQSKAPLRSKLVLSLFYIVPTIYGVFYMNSDDAALPDAVLLAIILMYVVLVGDRSKSLAATQSELNMAAGIQKHMLPSTFPAFPERREFDIYATMDPAKEVGGDFYDFFMIGDDHLGMVAADVSGKGVPAALFSMIAKTMLKTQAQTRLSPEVVLMEVNASLSENNDEDMFVTVWLGVLEISTGELTYADAGHEKLLLYQNGAWSFLPKAGGPALAMWEPEDLELMDEKYQFRNQTIKLDPGDAIFQYTDGVTEATDESNELFGDDRLLDAMNGAPSAKPEELLPHIRAKIDEFVKDAPQFDDITMLGLRYKGTEQ